MKEKYQALFWEKVKKTDGCWFWTGAKNEKGYGVAWDGSRTQKAHRVSYLLTFGDMPGLCVLHRCDVPSCVNPGHLFLGTRAENNADMIQKGRRVIGGTYGGRNYPRGTEHPQARLTPDLVRSLRKDKKLLSYSQLASKYQIGMATAYKVVKGITWSHVK